MLREKDKSTVVQISYLDGIPLRTSLQAKTLRKFGYTIKAISPRGKLPHDTHHMNHIVDTPLQSRLLNSKIPRTLRVLMAHLEYNLRVANKLRTMVAPGDIVQLTHPFLLNLVSMLRSRRARIYYDAFEFYTVIFRDMGLIGRAFSWLCESLENLYVPVLDGVLCVNSRDDWLAARLKSLNPNTIELWNLPSLEYSVDECLAGDIRRKFSGKELIVYAGGLKPHKGLASFPDLVRQVASRFDRAHFLIIGGIKLDGDVQTWRIFEGIDNHCTYIPWVTTDVLSTYLREAALGLVLLLPTRASLLLGTGGGRKLFTYMAAGLPVVAPNHGSAWDLVSREKIGIQVNITKAENVFEAVLTLLRNKTLRQLMGRKARTLFLERYHWEFQESKLIDLFGND